MDAFPITSEDPDVRQQFAENIFQILRPLSALEMPRGNRPTDGDSSECSALSDPFSDLDESYILLDQRKKVCIGQLGTAYFPPGYTCLFCVETRRG